jgi:hypothetical protein
MEKYLICALAVVSVLLSPAAAGGWDRSADLALTLNQSGYSDSWAGEETGTITWGFTGNLLAEKSFSKASWRNTLKLQFGQTHLQDVDASGETRWRSPQKSSDRIFFESLLRFLLSKPVDPYVSLTVDTQFYDGSVEGVRRYLNPLLFTEAVGLSRTFSKTDETELLSRVGFALRQHLTRDVISIDPEETELTTASDGGLEWVTDFSHTFPNETAKYVTKLRLYQAFFFSEADELEGLSEEDYWRAPDIAWENTLSATVAKYVQFSLFFEILYDKEIDLRGQFRETLGVGLTYKLF